MTSSNVSTSSPSSLVVRLIVGEGANAGVHADIREGFYMIGRDRECQIRPKSRSVSERHCLVQHAANTVRVFDLDSEEGTYVNDEQLPPQKWRVLDHGDRLRCGRYWFEVAIYQPVPDAASDSNDAEPIAAASMQGSNSEVDLFDDNQWAPPIDVSDLPDAAVKQSALALIEEDKTADHSTEKSKTSSRPSRAPLPKPKIRHSSSRPRFQFSLPSEFSWQTVAAILLAIAVVGYTSWSVLGMLRGQKSKCFANRIDHSFDPAPLVYSLQAPSSAIALHVFSYSYSMKWYSCSIRPSLCRARVPAAPEHEHEHEQVPERQAF